MNVGDDTSRQLFRHFQSGRRAVDDCRNRLVHTFTANGESKVYNAGETYFIPAGLRHQITLHAGYSEVDYVDDPND